MNCSNESILILDFGGQYSQLIARRVRECNVYCEIKSYQTPFSEIKEAGYKGVILSGGANSVYQENSPKCDAGIFSLDIPVLGICYGAQFMAYALGGKVSASSVREYGTTNVTFEQSSKLFHGLSASSICWMSHTDSISLLPEGFQTTAHSDACPISSMEYPSKKLYAVQFHPEVNHTKEGNRILKNFLYDICGCKGDWRMSSFVSDTIHSLRQQIGDKKVLCALSGGVDSSVAALLVHKAVSKQLICIFVDHGLLRKEEGNQVERIFKQQFDINLIRVNAKERFLARLDGITDPEQKRKIIGEEFIRVFEEESEKLGKIDFLCQGTIYPDVVESGTGEAVVVKSHHNVGGLPETMGFSGLIEPLRYLFKDEVRKAGLELQIPPSLVYRQPFPGPGLAVRIIGAITEEKLYLLREADAIFCEEIEKAGLQQEVNQYFAVLMGISSVGVMGDNRTYDNTIALRAVTTEDFMTADWAKLSYELLTKVSNRIVNEVKNINRIVYDITSKPPSTIEWE